MYDKKAVFDYDDEGRVVDVKEVHSFQSATEYASFVSNAKAQKGADLAKAKEEAERKALEAEEAQKRALQTAYYSKWRIILVCDSLINDWQAENPNVSDELKDKALEVKNTALASASLSCEEWLVGGVKDRYERIFGRLE